MKNQYHGTRSCLQCLSCVNIGALVDRNFPFHVDFPVKLLDVLDDTADGRFGRGSKERRSSRLCVFISLNTVLHGYFDSLLFQEHARVRCLEAQGNWLGFVNGLKNFRSDAKAHQSIELSNECCVCHCVAQLVLVPILMVDFLSQTRVSIDFQYALYRFESIVDCCETQNQEGRECGQRRNDASSHSS